jgi:hypothetical protein
MLNYALYYLSVLPGIQCFVGIHLIALLLLRRLQTIPRSDSN